MELSSAEIGYANNILYWLALLQSHYDALQLRLVISRQGRHPVAEDVGP